MTDRQRQVLALARPGRPLRDVARDLGVSKQTVHETLQRARRNRLAEIGEIATNQGRRS